MLKRLTAAASLASALCLCALAAAAPLAQDAKSRDTRNDNRARPVSVPQTELVLPILELPPPAGDVGRGVGARERPAAGPGTGHGQPGGEDGGGPGPGVKVDYNRTFSVREVTSKAVILSKPEPGLTEEARRNETDGVVRLRAALTRDGKVKNISVIKGLPDGLTEKAIAAARDVKFRPARKDGRTVSQWVTLEYNFVIDFGGEESVEQKAVITEQPHPEYTEEARRNSARGKVVLDLNLYKDGRVRVRQVVEWLPYGLTEKAVEAALKIKFKPAEHGGRKVTVVRRVEYRFPPE